MALVPAPVAPIAQVGGGAPDAPAPASTVQERGGQPLRRWRRLGGVLHLRPQLRQGLHRGGACRSTPAPAMSRRPLPVHLLLLADLTR
eukprot:1510520-Prymnesium_polylepis.1